MPDDDLLPFIRLAAATRNALELLLKRGSDERPAAKPNADYGRADQKRPTEQRDTINDRLHRNPLRNGDRP